MSERSKSEKPRIATTEGGNPEARAPGGAPREAASPAAIRAKGVVKRFGETTALAGVDLEIRGGIVGLVGANGAGKSTFLRALLDLVTLDAGQLEVLGHPLPREAREARARLGFLPEEPKLFEALTGWEQLEFLAGLKGLDPTESAEQRKELLDLFDLTPRARQQIADYSLGMRKKIALCGALLGQPSLLLLDEPLNGLDTESMGRLRRYLEALAAAGTTIVLSSHVMAFIERICERVVILRKGQIVADGTPEVIRDQSGLGDVPFEDVFLHLALPDA